MGVPIAMKVFTASLVLCSKHTRIYVGHEPYGKWIFPVHARFCTSGTVTPLTWPWPLGDKGGHTSVWGWRLRRGQTSIRKLLVRAHAGCQ